MPNEPTNNGQLNNNPSQQILGGDLTNFNSTDYLLANQNEQPYTNGYVSNYLSTIGESKNPTANLNVGAYGVGNEDYFPGRQGIQAGNYQGSIVGNVPIFTPGDNLFPFGVLEKRRDALNLAAMQYFERSLRGIDVQRKPLKNELLADKLNDIVLSKTDYFIEEARKLDPARGIDMMMSGQAGTLSDEWRKFRSDINTWSGQFDYIQDAAVQTEAWAAEGFYVNPDFKKVMYDVLKGADDIENGVITGEGEQIVGKLKRYASIPQITKDILQNVVMTQTVEYLDASGNTVSTNLSTAIDNAKKENNTTLLQQLTTKYLSNEQLDSIVGSYVTSLHGDLFYGNTKVNGQYVTVPKDDSRLYDYNSLYESLRGMTGVQKGIQVMQIQEPRGNNVTVNNYESKDGSSAMSWIVNSFKTLYSDAEGDAGLVFVDAKNYAQRTGSAIRVVTDGVETYVPISNRDQVVESLSEIGARQPKVTGIGDGMPASSVSLNMLSNELLTESISYISKNQEKLQNKRWNINSFQPYTPETKEVNGERKSSIKIANDGMVSVDEESSLYNLVGFMEANGGSVIIPVETTPGKSSSLKITGVSKIGDSGFYLESNGRHGILVPTSMAQSSGGSTNVQSEDASNISLGTQWRWIEGAYYSEGDNDQKGSYVIKKRSDGKAFEENGSAIIFPKSGITADYKNAMKNQIIEPYNQLKTTGMQTTGARSYTMTQNVSGQEPISATLGNQTYDIASFNNLLKIGFSGKQYWDSNKISQDQVKEATKLIGNVINMYQDALEPGKEQMYSELWGQFDRRVQDAIKESYSEYKYSGDWNKLSNSIMNALYPRVVAGTLKSYSSYVNYYK